MLPRLCLLLVTMLAVSAATAKGVTARIVISGDALAEPIVITDAEILDRFSIWQGPRSGRRIQGGELETDFSRTYVDFPAGVVAELPPELFEFTVEFYQADAPGGELWDDAYVVEYAMNPGIEDAFFYLPTSNRHMIIHGVEGNWLHASNGWEESVRPLIERAILVSVYRTLERSVD